MKPRTILAPLFGVVIACGLAMTSSADDKPVRRSGGGGFPLTASLTSMWGAVDELVMPGEAPLTFMIYFVGDEGWHQRKWESKQQWNSKPVFVEFSCDLVTLRAEVDPSTRILTIFGQAIDLSRANVVLVEHVDRPSERMVTGLGHVSLVAPEDSNPAVWVLENNEAIRSRVVATSK